MKSQVQKFVGYLLAGDQDSAWEVVLEEIHQGKNSLDIYENLITTAMRVTGDMWEENIISVADEHVATTTCDYVLTRYRFYKNSGTRFRHRSKGTASMLGTRTALHWFKDGGFIV
ncbi:B12-binding domain-containing protein [Priestia megaterium]